MDATLKILLITVIVSIVSLKTTVLAHGKVVYTTIATHPLDADAVETNTIENDTLASGNVGLAFGLVAISAFASFSAAFVPFLDRLNILPFKISQSRLFLAGCLSLSAGVMIFVSLTDILNDSQTNLSVSTSLNPIHSKTLSLALFLGAVLVMMIFTKIGVNIDGHNHGTISQVENKNGPTTPKVSLSEVNTSDIPIGTVVNAIQVEHGEDGIFANSFERHYLKKSMFPVLVALALHNVPEGLVILTGALASNSLGTLIAIGLIFHKIPEGMILSLPYYYVTKTEWLRLLVSFVAGVVFQFLGAILGYVIFITHYDTLASGIILSFVAGVLFFIAIHSLLPHARTFDPDDRLVTYFFFFGVVIVSISESILSYTGV